MPESFSKRSRATSTKQAFEAYLKVRDDFINYIRARMIGILTEIPHGVIHYRLKGNKLWLPINWTSAMLMPILMLEHWDDRFWIEFLLDGEVLRFQFDFTARFDAEVTKRAWRQSKKQRWGRFRAENGYVNKMRIRIPHE